MIGDSPRPSLRREGELKQISVKVLANILSVVLYPLFIPVYGMILFCIAFGQYYMPLPTAYWLVTVLGTAFLTCVIPLTSILIMMWQGRVKDIQIADAKERTMPYLYSIVCFGFWAYFLYSVVKVPTNIVITAVGATLALGIVAVVNKRWKISAHLTGFGGLTGGVLAFYLAGGMMPPMWLVGMLLGLALVLMYARLYLDAHTPMQVVCGWLLGIAMTFVPNMICMGPSPTLP